MRTVAALVGAVYLTGLIVGVFALGLPWLISGRLPEWDWWEYALAPLGIGLLGLLIEGVARMVGKALGISRPRTPLDP